MRTPDVGRMSPAEIQRELAEILAAGYLRLCSDAARSAQGEATARRNSASEGQNCAPAGEGEGP